MAIKQVADENSEVSVDAEYYAALCAMKLFNKDAEYLLTQFVLNHPESPKVGDVHFQLGKYNYRKKKWDRVLAWMEKVNTYYLSSEELAEYYFQTGYSHFQLKNYEEASRKLYEIKDVETIYFAPAQYYYSHIAYEQGNFETALVGFRQLQSTSTFGPIVPYYIVQIYYKQGRNDELIAYATPLLDSIVPKREAEIARLLGEAHYNKEDFAAAIPFLEKYQSKAHNLTDDDRYQLAYSYYRTEDYGKAILGFSMLSGRDNALAQTSLYHLADCYMKDGKKVYARNAYLTANKMDYDLQIKEDALFKYAQLSYDLSYDPYGGSIEAFKRYIEEYPGTSRAEEAYDYLVNLYLSSNDYDAAIASLEAMDNLDLRLKEAYQRVTYNKGVKLFQAGNYDSSVGYFFKSQHYPVNGTLETLSKYWTAEAHYRDKDYASAIKSYKDFIFGSRAVLQKEFNRANYNIGYAYYKQEQYQDAVQAFRRYASFSTEGDSIRLSDAMLRTGDCYYVMKNYGLAVDYYGKAVEMNHLDVDYGLFQQGMAFGFDGRLDDKVATMNRMLNRFPGSYLQDAAKYEMGRTYIRKNQSKEAIAYMQRVVDEHPKSSYVRQALVSIGQTHYNAGEFDNALAVFTEIVNKYATLEDTREALKGIQNICTTIGEPQRYIDIAKGLDYVDLSAVAEDSLYYESASQPYFDDNCPQAIVAFGNYLEKFDTPVYAVKAHHYRGECLYKKGEFEKALADFNFVVERPTNEFTQDALVKASELNFTAGNYEVAAEQFKKLEGIGGSGNEVQDARIGMMRSYYEIGEFEQAIAYSDKVRRNYKIDDNLEAETHLLKARSLLAMENTSRAMIEFRIIADGASATYGAEAKYQIAALYFDQDQHDLAVEEIYQLVEQYNSEAEWVAKGLILLGDIYVIKGEVFQAKTTYKSIVDNYPGEDLKEVASKKLELIIASEAEDENQPEEEELEVPLEMEVPKEKVPPMEAVGKEKETDGKKTNN